MKNDNRFAVAIEEIIKSRNLTQAELARMLGTTRATVSRWISGKTRPNIDQIVKIEQKLGLSMNDILHSKN